MLKANLTAIAVVVAWAASLPALAQDAELGKIREEIRQMKEGYEKRIQELEKRLSEAEAKAGRAESAANSAEHSERCIRAMPRRWLTPSQDPESTGCGT